MLAYTFSFQTYFFLYFTLSCYQNVVRANPVETKRDNAANLIDLSISSEPSDVPVVSRTQSMPSSNNENLKVFEPSSTTKAPKSTSANTLEALILELSLPSTGADNNPTDGPGNAHAPATVSGSTLTPELTVGKTALPISIDSSVAGSNENLPLQTSNASPPQLTTNKGVDIALKVSNGQQLPSTHQQQTSDHSSADTGLISQMTTPVVVPNFEVSCLM